jgi:hypothetical protein
LEPLQALGLLLALVANSTLHWWRRRVDLQVQLQQRALVLG